MHTKYASCGKHGNGNALSRFQCALLANLPSVDRTVYQQACVIRRVMDVLELVMQSRIQIVSRYILRKTILPIEKNVHEHTSISARDLDAVYHEIPLSQAKLPMHWQ